MVTNDPAAKPQRPITRGDALPNGAYVIADTIAATPYLADPIVAGVALQGLPGGPVTIPFGGTWPELVPVRLVVEAGTELHARAAGGVLTLSVPPGFDGELTLSCTIAEARLAELDHGNATRDEVLGGRALQLSAPQPLRVVHPVKEPLAAPVIEDFEVRSDPGRASADVRALIACDVATTGQVDLEASWTEVTDTGTGPLETAELKAVVASQLVNGSPVKLAATQHLGDLRHRELRYSANAATRFREYFRPGEAGARRSESAVTVQVPNRMPLVRPEIDAVLPTFRWTRKAAGGVVTSVRETAGLRVWLKRKWLMSGAGELLGVVLDDTRWAATRSRSRDLRPPGSSPPSASRTRLAALAGSSATRSTSTPPAGSGTPTSTSTSPRRRGRSCGSRSSATSRNRCLAATSARRS